MDKSSVSKVDLLPNANLIDGRLRGSCIYTDNITVPQFIGDNTNKFYVALKLNIKELSQLPMYVMYSANILLGTGVKLLELGIDMDGTYWAFAIIEYGRARIRDKPTAIHWVTKYYNRAFNIKRYTATVDVISVVRELLGNIKILDAITVRANYIIGNMHLAEAQYNHCGPTIIAGDGGISFIITDEIGVLPTSCGRILNEKKSKLYVDSFIYRKYYRDVVTNRSIADLPFEYRNPLRITNKIKGFVRTLMSIKT